MVTMRQRILPKLRGLYLACLPWLWALWAWIRGPERRSATAMVRSVVRQIKRNMTTRRLLNLPHALVLVWMVVLLWGERWVFDAKVERCDWDHWEAWPKGATPHHLVLVADPQIIDAHSYPGRPWPLSALTVLVTDNYMRRGFAALQRHLHPDSLFFLGDLFDGGREWKTEHGEFVDPLWGSGRPNREKKWLKTWHRKYGESYWIREYQRFNDIFTSAWNLGGEKPGPWQRARKLVASLPGNHDLGFGAQVQVAVRDRFSAFFGDVNRVDIIGNHTIVSVDSVSFGANSSPFKEGHDLEPVYGPVNEFLAQVQQTKRKAVKEELRAWFDDVPPEESRFDHKVDDLSLGNAGDGHAKSEEATTGPELPTILLTHVPLYREPGTPCGPLREHWPPAKPPKGQTGPVVPDHGNAIAVAAGYQYQNVLNRDDSERLVASVGNVTHVFSGDDHDYCELEHPASLGRAREITVKSFSMAMGVPTPGFLMVSLFNPVDAQGRPLSASAAGPPGPTIQTHLCLLPRQMYTYLFYVGVAFLTVLVLAGRALLVPMVPLEPFALEPVERGEVLPLHQRHPSRRGYHNHYGTSSRREKAKEEPPVSARPGAPAKAVATSGARRGDMVAAATDRGPRWSAKKSGRSGSSSYYSNSNGNGKYSKMGGGGGGGTARRWGWADDDDDDDDDEYYYGGGPRIRLDRDFYLGDGRHRWRVEGGRKALAVAWRELWTTVWRVVWMVLLFWGDLARRG